MLNYFEKNLYKELTFAITSFTLAFGIVLKHENDVRVPIKLGLFIMVLGFVFFISMTKLLHKILLCSSYGLKWVKNFRLSISDCLDISNKLISALQAVLSCIFGFLICAHSCRRNFLTTSHIFSEAYAFFASAYFLYDIWSMFIVYVTKYYDNLKLKTINWTENMDLYNMIPAVENGELKIVESFSIQNQEIPSFLEYIKKNKLMIFHHMFIGGYGLIVISSWRGGLGDCIFSFMYIMEMSTPFVSFRAVLSILKMKESKLYVINGFLMILSFLCFRIVMLPLLMYKYSLVVSLSMYDAIIKLPSMCQLSILALFLPQIYWFILMIKIALKMIRPAKPKVEINHNHHHAD
ncbi:TLC domain-containing protein 3A [Chironomus tepperi]|uniref:TLC domain-containing protein 3A n=1 Tax=Chironomus tepperi TaxID=113505 RepID=UPI00391F4E82